MIRAEFTTRYTCKSHAHCGTCRVDPEWRERVGAPDVCPDGFTADKLPDGIVASVPQRELTDDDYDICDGCQFQDWPSGAARGCEKIAGGKACTLGNLLRAGGPWPDGCPRKT